MIETKRRSPPAALLAGALTLCGATACEYDDFEKKADVLAESIEAYRANGAALEAEEGALGQALQNFGLESEASIEDRLQDLERDYAVVGDAVRRGVGGSDAAAAYEEAKAAMATLNQHVAIMTQPYGDHRLPDGVDDAKTALDKLEGALGRARGFLK